MYRNNRSGKVRWLYQFPDLSISVAILHLYQWRSKGEPEAADHPGWQSGGGGKIVVIMAKMGGDKGASGTSRLLAVAKLQSAPDDDNPCYITDLDRV